MANAELKIQDVTFSERSQIIFRLLCTFANWFIYFSNLTLHSLYMRALSCSYFFGVLARGLVMDYITRFSQPVDIGVAQTD